MRYLVTGGAGFLGSHLVDLLIDRGDRVAVLDDFSTGRAEHLGSAMARAADRLAVVRGSVLDEALVCELVGECDAVLHLAAVVGVGLAHRDPLRAMSVNVRGTEIVLGAATNAGVPAVFVSSSEVYGSSPAVPFVEDQPLLLAPTTDLRGGYAGAKALGEWIARCLIDRRQARITIVRPFNTVGPRQLGTYGMVLPRFVEQALAGGPLTVFGDGTQTRCFAHVADVAAAVLGLAERPSCRGRVFNVGSDREVSIRHLAELVIRQAGSSSAIAHTPFEVAYPGGFGEVHRRVPDLGRLRAELGPVMRRPLEDIVDDVISARAAVGASP